MRSPTVSPVTAAYLANSAALKRWIWHFTHGVEVDDIAQETFVRAYVAELERPIDQPKSFLFCIAKHLALSRLSNWKLWQMGDLEDDVQFDWSPEDHVVAHQTITNHMVAISELPPVCRKVFCLRRIEGLSQEEVSDQLGIAINTVEQHMVKAGKRVRL